MDQIDNGSNEYSEEKLDKSHDDLRELPIKDFSYVNNSAVTSPPPKKKRLMILIILAVIVIVAVVLAFVLSDSKTNKTPQKTKTTTTNSVQTSTKAPNVPLSNYNSADLSLTVNYPKTWKVTSPSDTTMFITSPAINIKNAKDQTVKGKIIIGVEPQGQTPTNFGTADATAVLASQLMKYTNPTSAQRAQTYVTFAQYAATTTTGGLDAIILTGDNGYIMAQDIPASDLTGLDPLVTVTFEVCQNSSCSSVAPLTVSSSDWKNLDFQTPIMDTLKSFAFS